MINVYLLSGNSTAKACWDRVTESFSSALPPTEFHALDYEESVNIDDFVLKTYNKIAESKRIILVGLSLGGHVFIRVAQMLVENNKDLLGLLISGAPPMTTEIKLPMYEPREDNEYIVAAMPLMTKLTDFYLYEATTFVRCQVAEDDYEKQEVIDAIVASTSPTSRRIAASLLATPVNELDMIIQTLRAGTKFRYIHASDDAAVSIKYVVVAQNIVSSTPDLNFTIVTIQGPHMLPLSNPIGFAIEIEKFIQFCV